MKDTKMKTLNGKELLKVLSIMRSCKTLEQFWSWLDWIRVLKIDMDSFKYICVQAKKFSREKWPLTPEMENFRNVQMFL